MTNFNRTIRTYDQANEYLGLKPRRPISHNTDIVRRDDGAIQVKYHGSPVVTYLPAGEAQGGPVTLLDSCGWRTPTTKERINAFCPAGFHVWQERSVWHLSKGSWQDNASWTFADGITIDSYGQVFNAGPTNEAQEVKKLVNRIRKYAKHYAQELVEGKLEAPDPLFSSIAAICKLGEVLCSGQKETNDWKTRMIKAGLGNRGLEIPDDWDTLSEDEKETRLNNVIKELTVK